MYSGDSRGALESFFQEWFSSSWLRWHFRERVRDKHKIIPQVVSSNLTESLLSKFCVNTHKGFRNASYEKFYHPFQTSRSHWHFCCRYHTVNSSRYFHRSVEKVLDHIKSASCWSESERSQIIFLFPTVTSLFRGNNWSKISKYLANRFILDATRISKVRRVTTQSPH